MMAQTFSYIIPRSPGMAIARCKKETQSNSKSFRDRKARRRPTSPRPVVEAISTHLAGRRAQLPATFYLGETRARDTALTGRTRFRRLCSINCGMAGDCSANAGAARQPNHRAESDLGAASYPTKVERTSRTGTSRCRCADSRARSRADDSEDRSVAEPMALLEPRHARDAFFANADVI
jgi:hypothetical protein